MRWWEWWVMMGTQELLCGDLNRLEERERIVAERNNGARAAVHEKGKRVSLVVISLIGRGDTAC